MYQAITHTEYNQAVMRDPKACPLFIMGDLRSGQQVRTPCRNQDQTQHYSSCKLVCCMLQCLPLLIKQTLTAKPKKYLLIVGFNTQTSTADFNQHICLSKLRIQDLIFNLLACGLAATRRFCCRCEENSASNGRESSWFPRTPPHGISIFFYVLPS